MNPLANFDYDVEVCAVCQQPLRRRQCLARIRSVDPKSICPHILHYECALEVREKCPNVMTLDGKEMADPTCSPCPTCRRLVDVVELILPDTTGIPAASTSVSSSAPSSTSPYQWPEAGRRLGAATTDTHFSFGASRQGSSGTTGTNYSPLNNNTFNNVFNFGGSPPSRPSERPRSRSPSVEYVGTVAGDQPTSSARSPYEPDLTDDEEDDGFCRHCGQPHHQDAEKRRRCKERRFGPYPCPFPGCFKMYDWKDHLQRHHKAKHGYRMYCCDMKGLRQPRPRRRN